MDDKEAFEAWHEKEYGWESILKKDGDYIFITTAAAWIAWQHQAERVKGLVEAAYREGWRTACPDGERSIHAEDIDWRNSKALSAYQGGVK